MSDSGKPSHSSKDTTQMRKLSFLGFSRGDDSNENEVHLDEEMARVFSDPSNSKFDVRKLSDVNPPSKSGTDYQQPQAIHSSHRYNEEDYESHRKSTYPSQPYAPIKSYKNMNKQASKDSSHKGSTSATSPASVSGSEDRDGKFSSYADYTSRDVSEDIDDEEPTLSERVATHQDEERAKKVLFNKEKAERQREETEDDRRRRKERQTYYKTRKASFQEYHPENDEENDAKKVSTQPEDAAQLEQADLDDLNSHRSEDPAGMRRGKISGSAKAKIEGEQYLKNIVGATNKRNVDRSPHEVFVQLDELHGQGEEREWKETARWIKYEEDVEEGADRWGAPHVASLSFHSLLNLRRCLETGVVLMDLDEKDLPGVAYRVVEQMVIEDLIHPDDKPAIMRALLLRHRHVNDHYHGSFHFGGRRKYSSYSSLQNVGEERKKSVLGSDHLSPNGHQPRHARNGSTGETKIDMREEQTYTASQEDLKRAANDSILKRIPQNAEATTVLVGAVDFLEQPTIAFVRLAEGCLMPNITEVPIPVRFLFILLGPKTTELDYHEVGRSIATLMSNTHFHNIAYRADDRRELLSAINEFLDDSIVLPPGKWDREQLLPFEELKAKSEWIRTRKKKALKAKALEKQHLSSEEEKKLLAEYDEKELKKKKKKSRAYDEDGDDDPLKRTGRLFGGMINDLKRRLPLYKSDIQDGLNSETLAATLFLYFAGLATAITFGGLIGSKTHELIGISETLVSACFVGMIFHGLASQPLVFVGTTGPLILFDEALIKMCEQYGYSFLTVRVYVGLWLTVIALAIAAFEGSAYVRLFTRFLQEIFSALITLIYLVETALKLVVNFKRHPLLAEYVYAEMPLHPTTIMPAIIDDAENELDGNATTIFTTTTEAIMTAIGNMTTDVSSDGPNLLIPADKLGPLNQPNTALLCMVLTLGTFVSAYSLKIFRNSKFLGRNARRALGDFGVPISIFIFVMVDYSLPQVFTDKLNVPDGISPSDPSVRGWLISWAVEESWLPFACIVPAFLVFILIFMETQISELIVGKPERGLKKGNGLHWDIVLLCLCNTVCGMFGLPWHCAATVRSVTHVSAVTIMSTNHAPGDSPKIADIKEQRLSGFFVSLMTGLSIFAAPLLKQVPMAVLFGVFLYMGVCSMVGVQFFERLRLFFMPVKHHGTSPFVRRVPTWKMHIFTFVQVAALVMLWTVKSSSVSLLFPFFLIMMIPVRKQFEKIFTPLELRALDGAQQNADEDEPDFYEQAPLPA